MCVCVRESKRENRERESESQALSVIYESVRISLGFITLDLAKNKIKKMNERTNVKKRGHWELQKKKK